MNNRFKIIWINLNALLNSSIKQKKNYWNHHQNSNNNNSKISFKSIDHLLFPAKNVFQILNYFNTECYLRLTYYNHMQYSISYYFISMAHAVLIIICVWLRFKIYN